MKTRKQNRKGTVAALLCVLMLPLLMLLALSVDYGFLLYVRTDLQRVADQAALAGVRDLVPESDGYQDVVQARETVREYVQMNLGDDFSVLDADIEIGRYDPSTIYSSVDILGNGIFDTVRVTIRNDELANQSVSLFFARLFNQKQAEVSTTSTAILQKGRYLGPGAPVFPFAMSATSWNSIQTGEETSIYGDGHVTDGSGNTIPGNWGTVDIGPTGNSTNELSTQIENGLSQNDLNSLEGQGAIPSSDYIDGGSGSTLLTLNADSGLSAGLKHAVEDVEGSFKLMPIYTSVSGNGNNAYYQVSGWAAVKVIDSKFQGNSNTYITVQKSYIYDTSMRPGNDLSDTSVTIEGAYTSPVLVQ